MDARYRLASPRKVSPFGPARKSPRLFFTAPEGEENASFMMNVKDAVQSTPKPPENPINSAKESGIKDIKTNKSTKSQLGENFWDDDETNITVSHIF